MVNALLNQSYTPERMAHPPDTLLRIVNMTSYNATRVITVEPDVIIARQNVGMALSCIAGALGAWRNLIEASLLQGAMLPSGALLFAESLLSAVLFASLGFVIWLVCDLMPNTSHEERSTWALFTFAFNLHRTLALSTLALYFATAYVKHAGKLWLLKNASALRQKLLALLSPIGTWAISLVAWNLPFDSDGIHVLGRPWISPQSDIELGGFALILLATYVLVGLTRQAA
jgi:hypothetical protein